MLCKTVCASLPAALLLVAWWKRGRVTADVLRWLDERVPAGGVITSYSIHYTKLYDLLFGAPRTVRLAPGRATTRNSAYLV